MMDLARIRGSIPPLITPFVDGKVDYAAYEKLVDYQISNGTHGILVNGTTSEPSTLTLDERDRLVTLAIETAAGRVPIVAATGSQSLAETEVLTRHAVKAGADALPVVTPYYIKPPQRGLVIRQVPEHLVPRDRPVFRPGDWSLLLARSYARHLCRAHGAASCEIVRHSQEPIPPMVLFVGDNIQAGAFDELISNFGEMKK